MSEDFFVDPIFSYRSLYVKNDYDIRQSFIFEIRGPSREAAFVLSAHDRVRLIELLGGTDANSH